MKQLTSHQQTGTALITVVLIAAVVIVMVIESVKTVRLQKQLSSNLINRDQAYSYLMGMEELAKIWLKKAFTKSKDETVHLNQPWAQDNITFPLDGGGMTASIKDMQSCFNLNSIATPKQNNTNGGGNNTGPKDGNQPPPTNNPPPVIPSGVVQAPGQEMFEELVNQVNQNTQITGKAIAAVVRDWIDSDTTPMEQDGAEDDYYQSMEQPYRTANSLLSHVSELRVMKDISQSIYTALLPHVCVLPDANVNKINVNTITEDKAAILYAVLQSKGKPPVSMADVTKAISSRGEKGYKEVKDFIDALGGDAQTIEQSFISVSSDYFEMTAKAEIGRTRATMKTLFKREQNNSFKVVSRYFGKE